MKTLEQTRTRANTTPAGVGPALTSPMQLGTDELRTKPSRRARFDENEEASRLGNHDLLSVAVLLPCKNEALAIAQVISAFREVVPTANIWVCDNNSTDGTGDVARNAGAIVISERRPGKGHAMRRLFAEADADIYVMADGDGTYDVSAAPGLIARLVDEKLDMVIARRVTVWASAPDVYRRGHVFGNRVFAAAISKLFGYSLNDIFSGYRAFSRRFVRSFPALSGGFEIETELTIHALDLGLPILEVDTPYGARVPGSSSKLNTYRDGLRIAFEIVHLYTQIRPARFYGVLAAAAAAVSLVLGVPVVIEFMHTGLVPRFPTAILASALMVIAMISLVSGIILDGVSRSRRESKRLAYLAASGK